MVKILMFGPPGSGKGTASVWLAEQMKIPHISTGDIIREHVSNKTELGRKAEQLLAEGQLVPDDLMIELVNATLADKEGYILDGYPRTVPQARSLMEFDPPSHVVVLQVSPEVVTARLIARGRADDTAEIIAERLAVYERQTAPVLGYLGILSSHRTFEIDGSQGIDATREAIAKHLNLG